MRAIERQLAMLGEAPEVWPVDRALGWLPLSHDMGLFGCLMPGFATGTELVIGTPERFIRSPRTWFEDLVRVRERSRDAELRA